MTFSRTYRWYWMSSSVQSSGSDCTSLITSALRVLMVETPYPGPPGRDINLLSRKRPSLAADPRRVVGVLLERRHDRFLVRQPFRLEALLRFDDAAVVVGINLHELRRHLVPAGQHLGGAVALGVFGVLLDHRLDEGDLLLILQAEGPDHLGVDLRLEVPLLIEDIGDAAGHARGEVLAGRAQDDDAAARHVFAAVIAHGLDHRVDAGVAHAEALPRQAANVRLAAGGAVKGD